MLSRDKKVELLQNWADYINNIDDEICKGIIDTESKLVTNINYMTDSYTDLLCVVIGDPDNKWLDWYRFNNDMGRGAMEVPFTNGDTIEVSSIDRLLLLIDDYNNE